MTFSKSEFQEDSTVAEEARRYARSAVEFAERYFGIRLDSTEQTLPELEQALGRIHEMLRITGNSRETAEPFARQFGSYFGELLRVAHEGTWGNLRIYGDRLPALQLGHRNVVIVPWTRTLDRLTDAPEKSLTDYWDIIGRSLNVTEPASFEASGPVERTGERRREHYPLRHDQGYFETGATADNRQVPLGSLLAIHFDADGVMLGSETRTVPGEWPRHPGSGRPLDYSGFEEAVDEVMEAWEDELGFKSQPIRVRAFYLDECGIGIEDRPEHFSEFLNAPELYEPNEEARQMMYESIREWDESESFVLYWGNDLWLNGRGEVTSS